MKNPNAKIVRKRVSSISHDRPSFLHDQVDARIRNSKGYGQVISSRKMSSASRKGSAANRYSPVSSSEDEIIGVDASIGSRSRLGDIIQGRRWRTGDP